MMVIDGSHGEGGGQVLRTSLALSLVTGKAFRIKRIRAGRKKPGLLRQHLTAVTAAARVCSAEVTGAELGSQDLTFTPGVVTPGAYAFAVGTAGSCTLVLQTVLPALLTANGPSDLVLEGGTHNPMAPPFDFLERAYLPLVQRMGSTVTATLERPGFYPAGGGRFRVAINRDSHHLSSQINGDCPYLLRHPPSQVSSGPNLLLERGPIERIEARAMVAQLPAKIGERELKVLGRRLKLSPANMHVDEVQNSHGPGNVVWVEVKSRHVTEVFTGFGQKGVRAEAVAEKLADEVCAYLDADVPIATHLADQLLLLMAVSGGGSFRTLEPTMHCRTNADVIRHFLDLDIAFEQRAENDWLVTVNK